MWRIGLLEDVTTTNIWAVFGRIPTSSNFYVFPNQYPSLYRLSDFHLSWVPLVATGKPTDLVQEGSLWTREVELKKGVQWSDGVQVTAHDVAFTVNTALELGMSGTWAALIDPNFVERAEALGDHKVKFFFKKQPGLARWEFGLSKAWIVAKHFWEPVVEEAGKAGSLREQRRALFRHVPINEPTAGPMLLSSREQGKSIELRKTPNYYWAGSTATEYPNGAYVEEKPDVFKYQDFGEPEGQPSATLTRGPHVDAVTFIIFEGEGKSKGCHHRATLK